MHRLAAELAVLIGVWVSMLAIFVPMFVQRHAREEPYLKRVAKKYSIPPLDLR